MQPNQPLPHGLPATYPGRADQVHHVRRAVARHLAGCPAADDAVLIASELAANAIVHSASRPSSSPSAPSCTRIMSGSKPKTSAAPGAAGSPTAARTAWTWSEALTGPDGWGVETTTDGGRIVWARLDLDAGGVSRHVTVSLRPWPHEERRAITPGQTTSDCPVCDGRGSRDVSDVSRRQAASVNVPASLTSVDLMETLAAWAQDLALTLLADSLPRRWSHVQGVAARARSLAPATGPDADLLEAAAWLHDIGYLPELAATGLHGLDGARYLRDVQHAEPMLCRLVAHHSCAVIEAEERGLAHVLTREFAPPPRPLADALTFCDMTTSPDGEHVHVTHRLAEIHDRYGTSHLVSRSIRRATPLILEAVGHVNARAASTG